MFDRITHGRKLKSQRYTKKWVKSEVENRFSCKPLESGV
jgi:hypothetical protein